MRLFVGNIPHKSTESELIEHFESFGLQVDKSRTKILTDPATGNSRGFGFVELVSNITLVDAINTVNGTVLGGRALTVNEAKPRKTA